MAVDHVFLQSIDCIEKIDPTNQVQFEKLWWIYRHNMYAINFYLNYCVLPYETEQFESRQVCVSFHSLIHFSPLTLFCLFLPLQTNCDGVEPCPEQVKQDCWFLWNQ
jgi:hypothetical protein